MHYTGLIFIGCTWLHQPNVPNVIQGPQPPVPGASPLPSTTAQANPQLLVAGM